MALTGTFESIKVHGLSGEGAYLKVGSIELQITDAVKCLGSATINVLAYLNEDARKGGKLPLWNEQVRVDDAGNMERLMKAENLAAGAYAVLASLKKFEGFENV